MGLMTISINPLPTAATIVEMARPRYGFGKISGKKANPIIPVAASICASIHISRRFNLRENFATKRSEINCVVKDIAISKLIREREIPNSFSNVLKSKGEKFMVIA